MKLHVVSDIHDDYNRIVTKANWALPRDVEADVVIVAGDIAGRASRMGRAWLESQNTGKPMLVVLGNHDLWNASLDTEVEKMRRRLQVDWIHVLDAEATVIGGTRFVGATLWTDFEVYEDTYRAQRDATIYLNDFVFMRADNGRRKATTPDVYDAHQRDRAALESILATPFDGPTVVITHHAPSIRSLRYGKVTEALDASYASDLESMIRRYEPELWIHGHVHQRQDYRIGKTRVVANPKGYTRRYMGEVAYEPTDFEPRFVVDVQRHKR